MYCNNCGNEVHGERFCTKCGAPIKTVPSINNIQITDVYPTQSKKINKNKFIAIALVVVLVFSALFIFKGRSYKATINEYIEASFNADAKKMLSLMPKKMVKKAIEEEFDGDKKECLEEIEETLSSAKDILDTYGLKFKDVSYEIKEVEDMTRDDISEINSDLKEYDVDLKAKEGKEVEVKFEIPLSGSTQSGSMDIEVIKIGHSWYLYDFF